jgi:hypothetical protein
VSFIFSFCTWLCIRAVVLFAFVVNNCSCSFSLFSTVIYTCSDAPALSTNNDAAANVADPAIVNSSDPKEQWDDEALAATLVQKKAVAANSSELLDMKALDLKGSEKGDIQEKLRVEENKAKLAAAKQGMEKEAQRLKDEKEKKEQGGTSTTPSTGSRFGAARAGMAGGAKWTPPHMRAGGTSLSSRMGMGGPAAKVDTEDENLFPDLAAADAIIEKQKSHGPAYKVPKKTPVGGGATWGSKMKAANKKTQEASSQPEQATKDKGPKVAESQETSAVAPAQATEEAPAVEGASAPAPAAAAKAPIKPKKKKKKDLSTFKAAS